MRSRLLLTSRFRRNDCNVDFLISRSGVSDSLIHLFDILTWRGCLVALWDGRLNMVSISARRFYALNCISSSCFILSSLAFWAFCASIASFCFYSSWSASYSSLRYFLCRAFRSRCSKRSISASSLASSSFFFSFCLCCYRISWV